MPKDKPAAEAKKVSGSGQGKSKVAQVKDKAAKVASNPLVAEVVAATLVAAAAALRDPRKARQLAEAAADEIGTAGKQLADRGSALWQLAMDVAEQSADAVGAYGAAEDEPDKAKKAKKPKKKPAKKKKK